MPPPVIKTITVPCPPDRAFRVFTQDMNLWWPKDKNSVSAMAGKVAKSVQMEQIEGGAITEIDHTGTSVVWGSVSTFNPPDKLVLAWHIGMPAEQATTVEVDFQASASGTKITLKHHGWEAFGDDANKMRDGYNSGWVGVFEQAYAGACNSN